MCITIRDKYIDPFTDFGFKHIFGTEENKNLLISFLNDVIDVSDKIVDIEYRNPEKLGLNIYDRKSIYDILCYDEKKNSFIVELQRAKQRYFKDRSIYYTSFPLQEQASKGDWDYSLKKIYFISILDFEIEEQKHNLDYLTKVQLLNTKTNEVFYDKLTYYYIEMPKFKKTEKELSSHLEYWLYTLNNMYDLVQIPDILKKDKLIHQAFDISEFLALDKDKQFAYQQDLKRRWDNKNVMDYALECATQEAAEKGLQKGLEKGLEQGIEKGIEQGHLEEKLKIAKSLIGLIDDQTISIKTGVSLSDIKNLKREL